ncbi:MAG: hypothetical protein HW402_1428, partial [Dehalococcoidales bacterium]|nr:hypothetical protein [Dehalococcoidales bacterium]
GYHKDSGMKIDLVGDQRRGNINAGSQSEESHHLGLRRFIGYAGMFFHVLSQQGGNGPQVIVGILLFIMFPDFGGKCSTESLIIDGTYATGCFNPEVGW